MADGVQRKPILVLGGTGKTGRRIVERLGARGVPTRVGSRSGTPPFDWEERATWGPALHGVGAVYVAYSPDLAVPGAVETVGAFAELAVRSGVPRLVLLAGRGEPEAELAEQAVRDAGADLTVLRPAWFAQNFSEDYMLDYVLGGEVALPAGDTPEPFVDVDDIADVAVAVLTEDGHVGQTYELTGPRMLTFAEAVEEIATAAGREVRYLPISVEDHAAHAVESGVPVEFVDLLTYVFSEVLDGRNAHLGDGVQRVLGREPRDFAEYARDAAATGIWSGAPARLATAAGSP
ncbi:MAG TPA: NmrA family transcriptional regulator [Solirubrobacterales bacterium]